MQRWFLSYHSPDQALAERLKASIERRDAASHVFFAPTHLRAGGSWSAQLAQEIADATAFILLIGQSGIGKWQVPEYDEALDKWVNSEGKFPLVVVLLEGQKAPGLQFLRRLHWIITADPASENVIARLFDVTSGVGSTPGELWRFTAPYRGLEAMEEKDSDYFFGRKRETVEVIRALQAAPDKLPVLLGNSGVGKSSLAQAGVLAALKRQAWPEETNAPNAWPAVFRDSRQWCYLSLKPGTDPLKALVGTFLDTWQFAATDPERVTRQRGWIEALLSGKATLPDLIDATERRREELQQPKPPSFLLYVDQGEELYVRAEEHQRQRFSELLVQALADPRLHAMMSMRSDFLGHLQSDKPIFSARQHIDVPPLGEQELREIVSRPAQLLAARFETDELIDIISRRTAEDAVRDAGALPLLSYTLDDMWTQMVRRGDGTLRLPAQSFELAGVLVDRANRFLETHPGTEAMLRRVLTLRLATVHEDSEPMRRRAARAEFSKEEWQLVSELADQPNRLVVTVATGKGETYAEIAHEAIFRRWEKLRGWIASEREFLAWRSGLEAARRVWQATPGASKRRALLMGAALAEAQRWLARRREDLPLPDRQFIALSKTQVLNRRLWGGLFLLLVAFTAGLIGWISQSHPEVWRWYTVTRPFAAANIWPYALKPTDEHALKPNSSTSFRECLPQQPGKDFCPDMIVVPAGAFMMGSPMTEKNRDKDEGPQHIVTFTKPFAVSKFEVTFNQWKTCIAYGECPQVSDGGWGHDEGQPVIYVTWDDARRYTAWLAKVTGKPYRLLSEAEYEYGTRAGTTTAYPWGDDINLNGTAMANCNGCGSRWDNSQTAPAGSFLPNQFGLFDMVGNVWEWVQDCYHPDYSGAPNNGSPWSKPDCDDRVLRGGSWHAIPTRNLRSATRYHHGPDVQDRGIGFRVGRDLLAP